MEWVSTGQGPLWRQNYRGTTLYPDLYPPDYPLGPALLQGTLFLQPSSVCRAQPDRDRLGLQGTSSITEYTYYTTCLPDPGAGVHVAGQPRDLQASRTGQITEEEIGSQHV
jgi:hypothetical protein